MILLTLLAGCTDLTEPPTPEHTLPLSEMPGMLIFGGGTSVTLVTAAQQTERTLSTAFSAYAASPDGVFLTGTVQRENVRVLNLDLRGQESLYLTDGEGAAAFNWSPDGQYLALVVEGNKEKPAVLHIYSWNGVLVQSIPLEPGQGRGVTWAPDAKRLAVTVGRSNLEGDANLWLVDRESGTATLQAEQAWAVSPSWSPDGQQLVYAVTDKVYGAKLLRRAPDGQVSLVISTDTIGPALPHLQERFSTHVLQIYGTFWSPDGKDIYLGFKSNGRDPRFGMFRVSVDGADMADWVLPVYPELNDSNIQPPRACIPMPAHLVTGGTRIAAVMYGPGCDGTLAILDAKTLREEVQLTIPPGARATPSPDGEWLAVSGEEHTDLITLRNGVLMRIRLDVPGPVIAWTR